MISSGLVMPETLSAEALPTPHQSVGTVQALDTHRFEPIRFRGGELGVIVVAGDGSTRLDVFLYDANGNLIDKDQSGYVNCYLMFRPVRTAHFYLVVVNRGLLPNTYAMRTN
jgi:hypothetical protein